LKKSVLATVATAAALSLLAGCTATSNEETEVAVGSSPTISESVQPEPIEPTFELSSLREDPEVCKIQEDSRIRKPGDPNLDFSGEEEIRGRYAGNATAFPFAPTVLPITGELNVVMPLVDWEDLPGTPKEYEFYRFNAEKMAEFWFMASEGKLKVNLTLTESWLRIPGSYQDLALTVDEEAQRYGERPKKQVLYDAIVAVSDPLIDYSDTHVVLPAWPRGKTVSEQGPHEFNWTWNAAMYTDEKTIYDIAGAGDWHIDHTDYSFGPWLYYVHEMGHMLGIPHQADEDEQFRDGRFTREEQWWAQNPITGFDIMGNQDGAIKTLSSWLRWLPGWLDDDQVVCITADSIDDEYFAINHLNDLGGDAKAVIVKLSETMVVVIESRRWDENYDRKIIHSRDGIVAYTVDATKASAQGNMAILSPREIVNWVEVTHWRHSEELDGNMCEGDVISVANFNIEAVSLQEGTDYVRLTKSDEYVDPLAPLPGTVQGDVNRIEDGCVFGPGADYNLYREMGIVD
jgi:M6 family metalloprotease-like protein